MEEGAMMIDGDQSSSTPAVQERSLKVRYYYTKRSTPQAGQLAPAADAISGHAAAAPCSELFESGAFYEIDHEQLPPKSPIHLKAIKVVMVSEATSMDVTVSFPSTLSLRSYFSGSSVGGPEMDERFVMGCKQATRILRRMIPLPEFEQEKEMERFWVVEPKVSGSPPALPWPMKMEEVEETPLATGGCLLALHSPGQLGWGTRRKVKYVGRHRETHMQMQLWSPPQIPDENSKQPVVGRKRTRNSSKKSKKRERKRARVTAKVQRVVKKEEEEEQQPCEVVSRLPTRGSRDRWSKDRYGAAEKKLLEIMREMKAELGSPVKRMVLREEARKNIGDTGLLDHLLKHMAGKIITNGTERFRRRHNEEGIMEYWLEPADLAENRRKAGVADPYWIPPPGWMPGDALYACSCGVRVKEEMIQLREEVAGLGELKGMLTALQSDAEQRGALVQEEKSEKDGTGDGVCDHCTALQEEHTKMLEKLQKMEEEMASMTCSMQSLKEDHQKLVQTQSEKEKNMELCLQALKEDHQNLLQSQTKKQTAMEVFLQALKEEIELMKIKKEEEQAPTTSPTTTPTIADSTNTSIISNQTITPTNSSSVHGAERRSGFRICKPQGTFLWPDMAAQAMFRVDGGLPTPPSASSATSRLLMLPGPASPVVARSSSVKPVVVQAFRNAGSENGVCPSIYCHNPRVGRGGAAAEGRWRDAAQWSNVATDLVLGTSPQTYRDIPSPRFQQLRSLPRLMQLSEDNGSY